MSTQNRTGLQSLRVERVPISGLAPSPRNPRTHSEKQLKQIERSISRFGWTNPILADEADRVLAGHGRLEAARRLGMTEVPVIRIEHMTEAEKRAYVIADNRLAETAGWDREMLAIELKELIEIENIDLDVTMTGFDTPEIDLLIGELARPYDANDPADEFSPPDGVLPPVTQQGDLWAIGRHRLLCGDTRNAAHVERLMAGAKARMVFTDPPYNVPIAGHVSGLGARTHDEFAMGVGEMSQEAFTRFLAETLANMAAVSLDGAIHYVCMDWRHLHDLMTAGREVYDSLRNICVWTKNNGGMGSFYRSQHELVAVYRHGKASHVNNVELGRHGRYRTNVWRYPGMNSFGSERDEALAMHPTVKPVALVEDAILDCSHRGEVVLDGFAGSGTTLIAAERSGRCGYGIEFDPRYVDVTLRRFRKLTGLDPVHEASGLTFGELE